MSNKIVNLTVHKNNKTQREAKRLRQSLIKSAKSCASIKDIDGYVVMAFSGRRTIDAWQVKDEQAIVLPEKVKTVIMQSLLDGTIDYDN